MRRREGRNGKRPNFIRSATRAWKSFVLGQNPREAPDLVKRVVERGRGDANDIWFPEVAFHVRGDKLVVQLLRMFVCQDRQLTTARIWILRGDDTKFCRSNLREQRFKIAGEFH